MTDIQIKTGEINMLCKLFRRGFLLVISLFVLQSNFMQDAESQGLDNAELAVLPNYCQARLGKNPDAQRLWSQRMGEKGWGSLHHYCFGLNFLNRAQKVMANKEQRLFNLTQAGAEFNYVLIHWPPNFPLRGEAQSYLSMTQMMARRP